MADVRITTVPSIRGWWGWPVSPMVLLTLLAGHPGLLTAKDRRTIARTSHLLSKGAVAWPLAGTTTCWQRVLWHHGYCDPAAHGPLNTPPCMPGAASGTPRTPAPCPGTCLPRQPDRHHCRSGSGHL